MKILLVNKLYHPDVQGGAETITQALAETHRSHGHDVTVATTADTPELRRDLVSDIPVYRLPLRNFYWYSEAERHSALARAAWHVRDVWNRPMARALTQVIRRVDPDVVSFHNLSGFSSAAWSAARAARKPALQVLHDYYHLCPRAQLFKRGQRCERRCTSCTLYRLGRREQSNHLQGVIGVSRAVLDAHLAHGLFGHVRSRNVIYNGVKDAEAQQATEPQAPDTSSQRGARVFGFMGTLGAWKGVQPMLEAFRAAQATNPELRLRVAGTGHAQYVRDLQAQYAHPSIEFVGRAAPKEFFRSLDMLIVPSLWDDPLPTVILEARDLGLPTLGARRGGIPELITPDVDGLLYDPSQPGDLTACLTRLASQPGLLGSLRAGCALPKGGPARSCSSNRSEMASAHERVYENVLRQGASA